MYEYYQLSGYFVIAIHHDSTRVNGTKTRPDIHEN